jgi:hypothetical protein
LGAFGSVISGITSAVSSVVSGTGSFISGIGNLFTKARDGEQGATADPKEVAAQLDSGQALENGLRTRMESAFGHDFSRVRIHADARASQLSAGLNARAFSIDHDIAFASGEYRPGTLVGDALLAHELAHVVQQSGGNSTTTPATKETTNSDSFEEEADLAAVHAVVCLWSRAKGSLVDLAHNSLPRLRSGLRLQRCGGATPRAEAALTQTAAISQPASAPCSADDRQAMDKVNPCCTTAMLDQIKSLHPPAIANVQRAYDKLASPTSVSDLLMTHFRLQPSDSARIGVVRDRFQQMLNAMVNGEATFVCRDVSDPKCALKGFLTDSDHCKSDPPRYMTFCANYKLSAEAGMDFLPPGSWVQKLIHEYVHISCHESLQILGGGAGIEFYQGKAGYPPEDPDVAIKNADSYANFAMEVK